MADTDSNENDNIWEVINRSLPKSEVVGILVRRGSEPWDYEIYTPPDEDYDYGREDWPWDE